jgi:cytochrome c oxidase subunit 3
MSLLKKLTVKPWLLDQGDYAEENGFDQPTVKIGLFVFLTVATMLFLLITAAYVMRMMLDDWRSVEVPNLLWLNTIILVLCSAAFQWTSVSASKNNLGNVRTGLMVSGALTLFFLIGQLMAWQSLSAAGQFMTNSPATAFFYFITTVHGLHVMGGLVAWGRTTLKVWRGVKIDDIRLSVELCAFYWHFLLFVWVMMFSLLLST